MDQTAAVIRDARRNLRDAECTLRSVEASLRGNEADLAAVRAWIGTAAADLNAATASGDHVLRNRALQALADAHDSLRDFERIGAEFMELKSAAVRTAIR
ncbi:MAG: hypothetical protein ACREFX_04505, partial [Opitutaceae bacterium]